MPPLSGSGQGPEGGPGPPQGAGHCLGAAEPFAGGGGGRAGVPGVPPEAGEDLLLPRT